VVGGGVGHGVRLGAGHRQLAGDWGASRGIHGRRVDRYGDAGLLASSHLFFRLSDVERSVVDGHGERYGRVERVAEVDGCRDAWFQQQRTLSSQHSRH